MGYSDHGAHRRLDKLADKGEIGKKNTGRWTVWYKLPEDEKDSQLPDVDYEEIVND